MASSFPRNALRGLLQRKSLLNSSTTSSSSSSTPNSHPFTRWINTWRSVSKTLAAKCLKQSLLKISVHPEHPVARFQFHAFSSSYFQLNETCRLPEPWASYAIPYECDG